MLVFSSDGTVEVEAATSSLLLMSGWCSRATVHWRPYEVGSGLDMVWVVIRCIMGAGFVGPTVATSEDGSCCMSGWRPRVWRGGLGLKADVYVQLGMRLSGLCRVAVCVRMVDVRAEAAEGGVGGLRRAWQLGGCRGGGPGYVLVVNVSGAETMWVSRGTLYSPPRLGRPSPA